jgi:hypothetical protein
MVVVAKPRWARSRSVAAAIASPTLGSSGRGTAIRYYVVTL